MTLETFLGGSNLDIFRGMNQRTFVIPVEMLRSQFRTIVGDNKYVAYGLQVVGIFIDDCFVACQD